MQSIDAYPDKATQNKLEGALAGIQNAAEKCAADTLDPITTFQTFSTDVKQNITGLNSVAETIRADHEKFVKD